MDIDLTPVKITFQTGRAPMVTEVPGVVTRCAIRSFLRRTKDRTGVTDHDIGMFDFHEITYDEMMRRVG